ncbi:MAG: hypothetical protein VB018_13355 [Lachnospiraceae bacterium]|nr:hypothetical protein [Lachnospiraceae bacterium]
MILEKMGLGRDDTQRLKEFTDSVDFKVKKKQIRDKLKESTLSAWTLTFTKTWVRNLMILSCLWVSGTFGLSLISGKIGIDASVIVALVDLSKHILTVVIAVMLGYMLKALFETKWEKQDELAFKKLDKNGEHLKGE